jgi:hypothetical protein
MRNWKNVQVHVGNLRKSTCEPPMMSPGTHIVPPPSTATPAVASRNCLGAGQVTPIAVKHVVLVVFRSNDVVMSEGRQLPGELMHTLPMVNSASTFVVLGQFGLVVVHVAPTN